MNWQKEKPDYACIFVGKTSGGINNQNEYELYEFAWEKGEPSKEESEQLKEGEEETSFCIWLGLLKMAKSGTIFQNVNLMNI